MQNTRRKKASNLLRCLCEALAFIRKFVLARYRVIIVGKGLCISDSDIIGFATTRFIQTSTEKLAKEQAIVNVAQTVEEESAFINSETPEYEVVLIERVKSPFKLSRPNSGYSFFSSVDEIKDVLEIEKAAGAGWFL